MPNETDREQQRAIHDKLTMICSLLREQTQLYLMGRADRVNAEAFPPVGHATMCDADSEVFTHASEVADAAAKKVQLIGNKPEMNDPTAYNGPEPGWTPEMEAEYVKQATEATEPLSHVSIFDAKAEAVKTINREVVRIQLKLSDECTGYDREQLHRQLARLSRALGDLS